MNILVVLAHPEPQSFNGALFDCAVKTLAAAGHGVVTSDLYRMNFDPVSGRHNFVTEKDPHYLKLQVEELHASEHAGFESDLDAEIHKIESCDLMILQFPLWWFGLPAILKGWVDRSLPMGRMYGQGKIYDSGVCRGKRAMLSLTTGGPQEAYRKGGFNGDIDAILRPIHRGVLQFVGFDVLAPQIHYGAARADDDERAVWLAGYAQRLGGLFDEAPITVGDY